MSEKTTHGMSEAKIQLLTDSLARANNYLEYGVGESTVLAAQNSLQTIISVDSSEKSIEKAKTEIENSVYSGNIHLLHANLGSTAIKGFPVDESMIKVWPQYYVAPWNKCMELKVLPDLILINGRFRTPCFFYSLLQCKVGSCILWNEYLNSPEYHFAEKALQPQGLIEDMVIFYVDRTIDNRSVSNLLFENLFNLD